MSPGAVVATVFGLVCVVFAPDLLPPFGIALLIGWEYLP